MSFYVKFSGLRSKLRILKNIVLKSANNQRTDLWCANEAFRITNFTSKTKHFTALLFFLAACNKKFQRANAQPYAHDASTNKSGWTCDSQARTRLVDSLYHVFAQKQCFLCSSLSNFCCLTLHYYTLLLHRFEIFSAPGTIAHSSIRLPPRSLESSGGYSLAIKCLVFYCSYCYYYSCYYHHNQLYHHQIL